MALLLLVAAGLFLRSLQEAGHGRCRIQRRGCGPAADRSAHRRLSDRRGRDSRHRGPDRTLPARPRGDRGRRVKDGAAGGRRLGLGRLRAPGYTGPGGDDSVEADWDAVTPGYFAAMQVPLTRGRAFTERDRDGAPFVAIVNEAMASRLWPGRDPIGQRLLQRTGPGDGGERTLEDRRRRAQRKVPVDRRIAAQLHLRAADAAVHRRQLLRRPPSAGRVASRRAAESRHRLRPEPAGDHTQTLKDYGDRDAPAAARRVDCRQRRHDRVTARGARSLRPHGVFGRAADARAGAPHGPRRQPRGRPVARPSSVGATGQRRRRSSVSRLAVGVSTLLQSLLVGVGTIDPLAFGVATTVLLAVLLAATWSPARRASRMDPMRALRAE